MTTMDWTAVRNDLIKQALLIVGVIPLGEEPDADQLSIANQALDSITKYLEAHNMFLWSFSDVSIPTVATTASYTITNGDAIGIKEAWYTTANEKYPLEIISADDYSAITDKTTAGTPEYVYFSRGINAPVLYLYPVPDAVLAATYRLALRLRDWDNANDNSTSALFPQWWMEPLKWKLAANLAHVFQAPPNKIALLEAKATDLINSVKVDNFANRDWADLNFYSY